MDQKSRFERTALLSTAISYVRQPNELIRLVCVAILWAFTFWCIQALQGDVSTAFVVFGRTLATCLFGYVVLRHKNITWTFMTKTHHFLVMGTIHAILPIVLFVIITRIVPKSPNIAMQTWMILGLALAVMMARGQPLRLRVLFLVNAGIVASAWIISSRPLEYIGICMGLFAVVALNSGVVWTARWYANRHLHGLDPDVTLTAGQFVALGWLLPIVSWYGTDTPNHVYSTLALVGIWFAAVAIAGTYRRESLNASARVFAGFAALPSVISALPALNNNAKVVEVSVAICIWMITLGLLANQHTTHSARTPTNDIPPR